MAKKYGKQYITLLGDPLDTIHPSLTSLYNGDATAVGLATLFSAMANATYGVEMQSMIASLLVVPAVNVWGISHIRKTEATNQLVDNGFSPQDLQRLCINRNPSAEERQRSIVQYGLKAESVRSNYVWSVGSMAFYSALFLVPPMILRDTWGERANDISQILSACAIGYKKAVSGAMRFNNVATGKWAIVDWPEPMEERQPQTTKLEPAYQRF